MNRANMNLQVGVLAMAVMASVVGCSEDYSGDEQWLGKAGNTDACVALTFERALPVPEASSAVWQVIGGQPRILVVGDSGNHGAYAMIDPDTGVATEQGSMPLGAGAGDDLEGMATVGDTIYGLISAGWVRTWVRDGDHYALTDGPYPFAPPGDGADRFACAGDQKNCGRNYEGLCLRPGVTPAGECAGYAASKTEGRLYCVENDGTRLRLDPTRSIAVTSPDQLSDCGFDPDGTVLWAGNNRHGDARVYVIDGWADPATASAREIDTIGPNSPEVLLPGNHGLVYRFSDTSDAPSFAGRYQCTVTPAP